MQEHDGLSNEPVHEKVFLLIVLIDWIVVCKEFTIDAPDMRDDACLRKSYHQLSFSSIRVKYNC